MLLKNKQIWRIIASQKNNLEYYIVLQRLPRGTFFHFYIHFGVECILAVAKKCTEMHSVAPALPKYFGNVECFVVAANQKAVWKENKLMPVFFLRKKSMKALYVFCERQ